MPLTDWQWALIGFITSVTGLLFLYLTCLQGARWYLKLGNGSSSLRKRISTNRFVQRTLIYNGELFLLRTSLNPQSRGSHNQSGKSAAFNLEDQSACEPLNQPNLCTSISPVPWSSFDVTKFWTNEVDNDVFSISQMHEDELPAAIRLFVDALCGVGAAKNALQAQALIIISKKEFRSSNRQLMNDLEKHYKAIARQISHTKEETQVKIRDSGTETTLGLKTCFANLLQSVSVDLLVVNVPQNSDEGMKYIDFFGIYSLSRKRCLQSGFEHMARSLRLIHHAGQPPCSSVSA